MANGKNLTNWNSITTDEAYRLSQAEFKGMTLQALQDIRNQISEIERDREIKGYINYFLNGILALIAGFFGGKMK